ncbi:MAG: helix-turn-helix domain-containing protein [Propionibacteriaceae bacterium]|jgi:DNA-binding XRE family transcriptional regulator|nr:helix-turn-helix domain-containing protein [Propionibacteriaceae bacterium]
MSEGREDFIATCDAKLRLVRAEADLTQEDMAHALGISKKTLVDIEKARRSLGFSGAVTLCAVFPDSEIISTAFGGSPMDMIPGLALVGQLLPAPLTSGNPWWEIIANNGEFIIEQNTISQHYRLLTSQRVKVASAFDIDDLLPLFRAQPTEEP